MICTQHTLRQHFILVGVSPLRLISEANFRFTLIRVRENSESIAFYDNSARSELLEMWTQFRRITSVQTDIINTQRNLEVELPIIPLSYH